MSTTKEAQPKKRTKTRTKKDTAAKTKRAPQTSVSSAKTTLSLLALSPYRFPVDVERLALQTARIGGFAIVFFAMLVTYNYIESTAAGIAVEATQAASVGAVLPCTEDCIDLASVTPNVTFSYAETVGGNIQIEMSVPKAEKVTVYAYETRTETYHRLGIGSETKSDTWQFVWNTDGFVPGDYWIKAVVENRHGIYDRSDSQYIRVQ